MLGEGNTLAERMTFYLQEDHRLGEKMAQLSTDLARSDKLAFQLEMGRLYGLRSQYYTMALRRQLATKLRPEMVTSAPWRKSKA